MRYIADLHIHSPWSRATSKLSHLHGLAAWAAVKGIDVVGTGDFTHPGWLHDLRENLEEAEPGFFRLRKTDPELYRGVLPPGLEPDISAIRFVLTSEISSIYKRGGRVRKVHNILFAPDLDAVRRVNAALSAIGNLESDGRPILGLDSHDLLEIFLEKAPQGFLVPAHIWTPWFSLFGSKSGFDTVEECFGDLTPHVFALETGLSSDPDMNRTISALDRYSLISNSDCHSPAKLGREANIFATGFDFFSLQEALKHPVDSGGRQRFSATVEFYPEEGKYHCDGHRKCGVRMEPLETREHQGICPECGRPMTVGVLYRVMELADRMQPVYPAGSPVVHSLVPLPELLGELLQVGPASKKVMQAYVRLIRQFGSEFAILLDRGVADLEKGSSGLLAEAVRRVRTGRVIRRPGYDGEFGVIRVFTEDERRNFGGQMNLFGEPAGAKPAARRRRKTEILPPGDEKRKARAPKNKALNPEQLQAVESNAPYIIVQAGPGTGKTHTLVQRLVRMVGIGAGPCTVITFTNKAAGELRERLGLPLGNEHPVHVSTLHGYCLKWLRRRHPGLEVAGPETRQFYLRQLEEQGDVENSKELDREITAYLQQAPDLRERPPAMFSAYFSALRSDGLVDIDAVVPEMITLLRAGDENARQVRQATGSLFIDEFQDLNKSQYQLVLELAATSTVFAIGDPDQAIYGFRGSSPSWFYRFIDDLTAQQFVLHRNYRSRSAIVRAAASLISNNLRPGPPVMNESAAGGRGKIHSFRAGSPREEAEIIVGQIEQLIGGSSHREIDRLRQPEVEEDVALGDIAVLYRTTRQANIVGSVLSDHGFPVQVVDLRPYYLQEPLAVLYQCVLLAGAQAAIPDLLAVLGKEKNIGEKRLQEIERLLPRGQTDVLAAAAAGRREFPEPAAGVLDGLLTLLDRVKQTAAAKGIVAALGLLSAHYQIDREEAGMERFVRLAENFGSSLPAFAHHLLLHNDSVVYDERAEAVTLMTLHASKGLEFKVVFLVGVEEGLLPVAGRPVQSGEAEKDHIEEERRLMYVGMTRAERVLYLSHVRKRTGEGDDAVLQPSRFLKEIPRELISPLPSPVRKKKTAGKARQLNLFK